jgi:hypothetical protein
MSNYYAQIDSNNIVVAISELHSEETYDHLIPISSFDVTLLGKQYDPATGQFVTVAPTLDQVKRNKIAELNAGYQASFTTFQSSALGSVHTYPIDQEAQDNMKNLMQLMILNPNMTTIQFKTLENGLTAHTRDQFIQVLMDAQTFEVNLVRKYESLEAQVQAATTIDEVNAIVWE